MKRTTFQGILRCGYYLLLSAAMISCTSDKTAQGGPEEYKVVTITQSDKTLSNSYPATIKGRQDIEIRPQISGLITEVWVEEGQKVRKGQTLFIIDQVAYRAALETAAANVELARANVETARLTAESKQQLYAENVISEYEMKTALNSLKSAQASLAQAKAQETNARNDLSYTVVKSPSDGVVGTLPYKTGALVNSAITTPLTTISDNQEMYVYFSMTEKQVLSLTRQNGSLKSAIDSMPEVSLLLNDGSLYCEQGRIETISGVIDSNTGAVSVRAVFPNTDRMLLSGGSGKIVLPYTYSNSIVIPQSATYELQDKVFAYKVVDGKAQSTQIQVLASDDGKTYVVESGLRTGDRIVTEGAALLRNGTPIKAKQENKEDAS